MILADKKERKIRYPSIIRCILFSIYNRLNIS